MVPFVVSETDTAPKQSEKQQEPQRIGTRKRKINCRCDTNHFFRLPMCTQYMHCGLRSIWKILLHYSSLHWLCCAWTSITPPYLQFLLTKILSDTQSQTYMFNYTVRAKVFVRCRFSSIHNVQNWWRVQNGIFWDEASIKLKTNEASENHRTQPQQQQQQPWGHASP